MFRKIIFSGMGIIVFLSVVVLGLFLSLDVSNSAVKKPADMIVALGGGIGSRVEKAWNLQTQGYGRSDKIMVTGIPLNPETVISIHPSLKYLKEHSEICYEPVSISETHNTWEEALYIKHYMISNGYSSVIIVTHPLHLARVKMALERVAHFKEAGLEYVIIGDREIDLLDSFLNDKGFRNFALSEMIKRLGYEVKALGYNIALRIEKIV